MPASLLDAFGRPVKIQNLTEELSGHLQFVREIWTDTAATRLTPQRLANIIVAARQGETDEFLTLAYDMEEREPHYGSVVQTRALAASAIEPDVEAASDSAEDVKLADAVRELLREPAYEDLVDGLLDATAKGFAVCEIIWEKSERQWHPVRYHHRDQRWFRFDLEEGEILKLKDPQDHLRGIPLAPYKFAVHYPRLRAGMKWASGLARVAAVSFMCKNYSVKDWMRFLETYGMPLRVGKYGPEATADERDILRRAVRGLGVDAAAIVPQSMEIDLIREASGQAGSGAGVFQAAADWFDSQVSKAVLGQTMTADSGSSLAQAKVHNEVRLDRVRFDSRKLARTINRDVVTPFIDLNFGPQKQYPRVYYRVPEPEDIAAWSDALAKLVPVGLRVEASQVRDRLGFADPGKKAEVLSIPTAAPATDLNHSRDCPHCRTAGKALNRATPPAADPDEIDDIAADHLDGWERQMDPILDPVRRLADEAETAEEFTRRLPELLAQMDSSELIRHLATAAFQARGQGDATDNA